MSLPLVRQRILARFTFQNNISYSVGAFNSNDWDGLERDVIEWWDLYKAWERDDTLELAFKEQRLTVKGTSSVDGPIQAQDPEAWGPTHTHEKPKPPPTRGTVSARIEHKLTVEHYPIKKTNLSIAHRLEPKNFVPTVGGASQKTELGLHDLSAGLMNPKVAISTQQYKTPGQFQSYMFMPLSDPGDQAVFQNINTLAKAYREQRVAFYNRVRDIRSRMTRVKLAAEHDMATNFACVGKTPTGRPKFKFGLLEKTDVSLNDLQRNLLPQGTDFGSNKVIQMPTTPGILQARQNAALNYHKLVLGVMHSYGEVVVSYREHAGKFPKLGRFSKGNWRLNWIGPDGKTKGPVEVYPDLPV